MVEVFFDGTGRFSGEISANDTGEIVECPAFFVPVEKR